LINQLFSSCNKNYDLLCRRCYKLLFHNMIKKRQQIIIETINTWIVVSLSLLSLDHLNPLAYGYKIIIPMMHIFSPGLKMDYNFVSIFKILYPSGTSKVGTEHSNPSFLRLSMVDHSIRFMEESITGLNSCSWSINYSTVATKIMICCAEDVINFCSTTWSRKDNKLL
jgi:hypothetical protein